MTAGYRLLPLVLAGLGLASLLVLRPLAAQESGPELGPQPSARLRELEHLLDQSRAERDEIQRRTKTMAEETAKVRNDMVAAAHAAQDNEDKLSALESTLTTLTQSEKDKTEALKRRAGQMTGVLTALQRLAWRPTEALLAQPQSPADTVRSAILLRAAVPEIRRSALELREQIDTLDKLRHNMDEQRLQIKLTSQSIEAEHAELTQLYQRKAQLQDAAQAAQAAADGRVARLLAEAQDLRDLMDRLEQEKQRRIAEAEAKAAAEKAAREAEMVARKAAEIAEEAARKARIEAEQAELKAAREQLERERLQAEAAKEAERRAQAEARAKEMAASKAATAVEKAKSEAEAAKPMAAQSFADAKGKILYPARGKVIERFNTPAESGSGTKGITIETRSDAQVVATFDGQVVFAGEFRGYGQLLIIEHSDGYHTLLAGMSRIDAGVGQRLFAGEPVGVMGHDERATALYVELRHNGQPINPLPWLSAHTVKAQG